jgi:hypothetical protein
MLSYIILAALSTAVASAAKGGGYGNKWVIMGLHFVASPIVALIFWPVFRRSRQAHAELNYYAGKGSTEYDLEQAIVKAYYVKPLGKLMARVMKYCKNNHWPHLTIADGNDGRRTQQELCGGFVIGLILGTLTCWVGL